MNSNSHTNALLVAAFEKAVEEATHKLATPANHFHVEELRSKLIKAMTQQPAGPHSGPSTEAVRAATLHHKAPSGSFPSYSEIRCMGDEILRLDAALKNAAPQARTGENPIVGQADQLSNAGSPARASSEAPVLWSEPRWNGREWYRVGSSTGASLAPQSEAGAERGWIRVSARMPDIDGSVFCCGLDPDGNYWREVCSGKWVREKAPPGFVTHWMPLPQPPAERDRSDK